jgi:DNA-binding HxlR family transcriptional regulator
VWYRSATSTAGHALAALAEQNLLVHQDKFRRRIESVAGRSYGQFCGLARALELVGERWALLIVRDLLVGPRRFTDLRQGLPRIPTNVLSDRLKELEQAGVVRRRLLPRPAASVVYELTEYGAQLDDVVLRLGLWGAQSLGEPAPDEIITADSMTMALRSTFRPEAARGVHVGYELRLGEIVLHARVADGTLAVGEGPLAKADLVIEAGPAIRAVLAGEVSPAQAIESGSVQVSGNPALLERFAEMFQIPRRGHSPAGT